MQRDATQPQIEYLMNLCDQAGKDDQFVADIRSDLTDPTHQATYAWASQMIDELKEHIAQERYSEQQPADKGRLAAKEHLNESPAERVKRIYGVAWELRGLSPEGFAKHWSEIGAETLEFHGVTV